MSTVTLAEAPSSFRALTADVRSAGLLDRRLGHYWTKTALTVGAFGAAWWSFFALGSSWATLGIAVVLGILSTQFGFLGHDAGHRQIFTSGRANRLFGLFVGNSMIGLSYGWWVPKHNAHHAHPNEIGRDPDVGIGVADPAVTSGSTDSHRNPGGWAAGRQAEIFFLLMLFRSTGLYLYGARDLIRRRDRTAAMEGSLLVAHAALYLTAVFWVLAPLQALAFLAVHQAVFSLYLGCSFAPNHKGMPLVDGDSEMSFAQRQVITSRNVTGGRFTGFVFGGLNYQIEHHLFPGMPRPNLPHAQSLVRAFCIDNRFEYREASAIGSFRQVVEHLQVPAIAVPPAFEVDHRGLLPQALSE